MESTLSAILEQAKDPAIGLPLLLALVVLNALFGIARAIRKGEFIHEYVLNFLRTRVLNETLPVALVGFAAIVFASRGDTPWVKAVGGLLSWVYTATTVFMAYDLGRDLMAKLLDLYKGIFDKQ